MLSKIDKYERINLLEGIFAEKMSDESKKLTESPEFKNIVDSSKLKPMDIQSFEDSLDRINDIVRQIAMEQETSQEDRNVLNTFIGNTTIIRELYRKSDPEHPCVVNVGLTSLVLVVSVLSASRATVRELVCELGGINDVLAGSFIDQLKNGEISVELSNMVIEPTTGSVENLDTNVVMNMASQIQEHIQLQESEKITSDVSLVAPIVLSSVFLILLTKMIRKANVFASTEDEPYSNTGKEIQEVYKIAVAEADKSTPVLVAWLKNYLDVTG